jgi:hypothetical protein
MDNTTNACKKKTVGNFERGQWSWIQVADNCGVLKTALFFNKLHVSALMVCHQAFFGVKIG